MRRWLILSDLSGKSPRADNPAEKTFCIFIFHVFATRYGANPDLFLVPVAPGCFCITVLEREKKMVKVNTQVCLVCGGCIELCPKIAIRMKNDALEIDPDKCVECNICVQVCPVGAPFVEEE